MTRSFWLLMVATLALSRIGALDQPTAKAVKLSPLLIDGKFVTPPQQQKPWKMSEDVPVMLRQAAHIMFDLGYADPRGCEYKEVTLLAEGDRTPEVHAWVFTGPNNRRYAVDWSGIVFQVIKESGPADLDADVAAVIEKDKKSEVKFRDKHAEDAKMWEAKEQQPYPFSFVMPTRIVQREEGFSTSHKNFCFDKALMLMRLGRSEQAIMIWNQWFALARENAEIKSSDDLVRDWLSCWKGRARDAHLHHDDELSLASLRLIENALKTNRYILSRPDFALIFGHEELLLDQERRFRERGTHTIQIGNWASVKLLPPDEYVRELIRWLDDSDRDMIYDIQNRIKSMGPDVLEVLLAEFVQNKSLTRRMPLHLFSRPPAHAIVIEPVSRTINGLVSYMAGLPSGTFYHKEWKIRNANKPNFDPNPELVKFARTEGKKNRGLSTSTICLRHLEDDGDPDLWASAADTLARELNTFTDGDAEPQTELARLEVAKLISSKSSRIQRFCEVYRDKKNPSLSELLRKRAAQLVELNYRQDADTVLRALADWEGSAN